MKNPPAAIQYCKKDGAYEERGDFPIGGIGKKCTVAERAAKNKLLLETPVADLVKDGVIPLNQAKLIYQCQMIVKQGIAGTQTEDVRGIWFYGEPGAGKSHRARTEFTDIYIKAQNKWFDGYTGQKTIVLDDLDCPALGHYLKIWADKWECNGEVKGGVVKLAHDRIVVTSNYTPEELWPDNAVMAQAIRRRFRMIKVSKLY